MSNYKLGYNKPVVIEWLDSGSVDGVVWQFKDSYECDVHKCVTVGLLVERDDDKVVIAQSSNDDQWGRLFAIPAKAIVGIENLIPPVGKEF